MIRLRNNKGFRVFAGLVVCFSLLLTGCGTGSSPETDSNQNGQQEDRLQVVTTIFPYYDFARQVAGEYADVSLIVPAGMDTHSFEPTAADMVALGKADVLIYNGGEMEQWVAQVIEAADNRELLADEMMSHVDTFEEEIVEGMEEEHEHSAEESHEEETAEQDEHIWTSPANACKLVEQIADDLSEADAGNSEIYQKNAEEYIKKIQAVDEEFRKIVEESERRYLVFGDRFPLRYFVEEYELEYSAAFAGCSADTEPSADTIAYLTDKVKEEHLPVVLKIELTSARVAEAIAEASGAKVETFYTCHNVTEEQLRTGESYVSLMQKNAETLKEALN